MPRHTPNAGVPRSSSTFSSASQPKSDGRPGPGESTTRSGAYESSSPGSKPARSVVTSAPASLK